MTNNFTLCEQCALSLTKMLVGEYYCCAWNVTVTYDLLA